jgi:hypothetical protein
MVCVAGLSYRGTAGGLYQKHIFSGELISSSNRKMIISIKKKGAFDTHWCRATRSLI